MRTKTTTFRIGPLFAAMLGILCTVMVGGERAPSAEPKQRPDEGALWAVSADVLIVQFPESEAIRLRSRFANDIVDPETWSDLLATIRQKGGTVIGWPHVNGVAHEDSGQPLESLERASSETILEKTYPTLFEMPEGTQTNVAVRTSSDRKPVDRPGRDSETSETRNCGPPIEISSVVRNDGRWIYVHANLKSTELRSMDLFPGKIMADGHRQAITQPQFSVKSSVCESIVANGGRRLVAIHKPSTAPGMLEFWILHVLAEAAK